MTTFAIEDTNEGCYRDVASSLLTRGWERSKTKLKRNFGPHSKVGPLLLWTINEKTLDFDGLDTSQICNHFEGITQLTTKMGFCDMLRDAVWVCEDYMDVAPRYTALPPTNLS